MPNGIFPIPAFKTVPPRESTLGLRVHAKTRLQRNRLDG